MVGEEVQVERGKCVVTGSYRKIAVKAERKSRFLVSHKFSALDTASHCH